MEIPTSTKEKGEAFEKVHIPENIYTAELLEVKDISEGQYGPRVAFIYKILDKNVELALICYKTKATKDNKIGQTLMAHGAVIDGSTINPETYYHTKVRVWVDDYKVKEDGNETGQVASVISKVKTLADSSL